VLQAPTQSRHQVCVRVALLENIHHLHQQQTARVVSWATIQLLLKRLLAQAARQDTILQLLARHQHALQHVQLAIIRLQEHHPARVAQQAITHQLPLSPAARVAQRDIIQVPLLGPVVRVAQLVIIQR